MVHVCLVLMSVLYSKTAQTPLLEMDTINGEIIWGGDNISDNFYYFVCNHDKWSKLFINSARHEMRGIELEVMEHKINPIGGDDGSDNVY